jgi:MSHA biogenesis protein MshI
LFGIIKKRLLPGLVAIGVRSDGVALVRVESNADQGPRLVARDFRPFAPGHGLKDVLASMAHDFNLGQSRCTTVLADADYKLLLTEAPDVAADEVRDAVRWRIKDRIDFHINDATLEVFDLPADTGIATRDVYVVAARNQALQERVHLFESAGIHLEIIDVPDLAQRNLATLLPENQAGVALLSFHASGGLLTLTRQDNLYLSRALNVGSDAMLRAYEASSFFDQIVLDVQRSLDYYESHFRQAPIRTLVVAPLTPHIPGLTEYLTSNFNMQVRSLDLNESLPSDDPPPVDWQGGHLLTIGAALRVED